MFALALYAIDPSYRSYTPLIEISTSPRDVCISRASAFQFDYHPKRLASHHQLSGSGADNHNIGHSIATRNYHQPLHDRQHANELPELQTL